MIHTVKDFGIHHVVGRAGCGHPGRVCLGCIGTLGQYHTVRGVCLNVDPDVSRTIRIDDSIVAFENIMKIESEGDVFSLSERTEDF